MVPFRLLYNLSKPVISNIKDNLHIQTELNIREVSTYFSYSQ